MIAGVLIGLAIGAVLSAFVVGKLLAADLELERYKAHRAGFAEATEQLAETRALLATQLARFTGAMNL